MENNTPVFAGATPNFGGGVPMHEKGGDSSTSYATLTEGNIVIGGKKVTAVDWCDNAGWVVRRRWVGDSFGY